MNMVVCAYRAPDTISHAVLAGGVYFAYYVLCVNDVSVHTSYTTFMDMTFVQLSIFNLRNMLLHSNQVFFK